MPRPPYFPHPAFAQFFHQAVQTKRQALVEKSRVNFQHGLARGPHRALDQALQLTDIAGPPVLAQPLQRLFGDRFNDGANPPRVLAEEEESNLCNVLGTLCERRNSQLSALEQRQELWMESARRGERRRRISNEANIRRRGLTALTRR